MGRERWRAGGREEESESESREGERERGKEPPRVIVAHLRGKVSGRPSGNLCSGTSAFFAGEEDWAHLCSPASKLASLGVSRVGVGGIVSENP